MMMLDPEDIMMEDDGFDPPRPPPLRVRIIIWAKPWLLVRIDNREMHLAITDEIVRRWRVGELICDCPRCKACRYE